MLKHVKIIIFSASTLLMLPFLVLADDDRHLVVDQAIGGMEQGSRIGAPGTTPIPITDAHKTISSSQGTREAQPNSISINNNHGSIYSVPIGNGPAKEKGGTGEGSLGTGEAETPNNPIIDVGIDEDLESGTIDADVTVDITEELEEKEIFEIDLEAEESSSTETQESNPIIDAQADIDLESGTIEADATVDTSGELEERQIIDVDAGAGETIVDAEVGSATDITQSDIVENTDITTQPVQSVIPIPADLTAEVDTTGATSGGEADVGIEADVEGVSEGEDVTCDPADALTTGDCGLLKI